MSFHFRFGMIRFAVLYLFILCLGSLGACQSIPDDAGAGNWANVTLRVTGIGMIEKEWSISRRIQAIQRAKVDAYTQLESQIMALQTTAGDTVRDLSEKDDDMQKKITAFVRGARIIRTINDEEGVKIVAQLFLGDNFKATIGIARRRQEQLSNPNTRNTSSGY